MDNKKINSKQSSDLNRLTSKAMWFENFEFLFL
jgi:hypothetical protein